MCEHRSNGKHRQKHNNPVHNFKTLHNITPNVETHYTTCLLTSYSLARCNIYLPEVQTPQTSVNLLLLLSIESTNESLIFAGKNFDSELIDLDTEKPYYLFGSSASLSLLQYGMSVKVPPYSNTE
jgi:hypothetical protein